MQVAPITRLRRFGGFRRILDDRLYSEWFWAYVFLAPAIVFFGTFTVIPVVRAFIMSFQQFDAFHAGRPFIGLTNYVNAVRGEPLFWHAIWVSALYTAAVVPPAVVIPLTLAGLIHRFIPPVQTFFKSAFYIPGVAAGVTITLVWVWILYPLKAGLANQVVSMVGIGPQAWLANVSTALPAIMLISVLTGWGGGIILYLAAMGGIPKSLFEAAEVDCASGWEKFKNITVPLIKPTVLFMVITGLIGSFQVFEISFVGTRGGPQNSTTTFVLLIYQEAFQNFQFGRAAAMAVILAVFILAASYFQFKWFASQIEY